MKKCIGLLSLLFLCFETGVAQHLQYLTPQVIDFDSVKEDTLLQGSILFVNVGSEPVTIRNVRTSCGCTVAQASKKECASGDTMDISFSFNTRGFGGLVRKTISILFQEADYENANFVIQANVIQDVDITPKNFRFSVDRSNSDSTITDRFTVHNYWNQPIQIYGVYEENDIITATPASTVIQPGEEKQFTIQLHLSRIEQRYITLTIDTDYIREPQTIIPVLIDIKD